MLLRTLIVATFLALALASVDVRYRFFDDYLSSLDAEEQAMFDEGNQQEFEGSGDVMETSESDRPFPQSMPLRTGQRRNKDVTCCALGQLAADKGYHCYVKFYASRIVLRNKNRAHNKKMSFYGRYSVPNYGTKLMRTFEQCVASRGMVFNKCCHLSAIERRTRPHYDTWQRNRFEMMKHIGTTKSSRGRRSGYPTLYKSA